MVQVVSVLPAGTVGTTPLLRDPIDGTAGTTSGAAVRPLPDIGAAVAAIEAVDGELVAGTTAAIGGVDLPAVLPGAGRP